MNKKTREEQEKEIEEFCRKLGITLYPYQMMILLNSLSRNDRGTVVESQRISGKKVDTVLIDDIKGVEGYEQED